MTIRCFTLILVCAAALLTLLLALPISARSASAPSTQTAPTASATPTAPASAQDANSLPPDKLAQAIAISHVRNILSIADPEHCRSIWGIVFL